MQRDLECPCCMRYIYNLYTCPSNHGVCGDCYMKIETCPLCRKKGFVKSNPDPNNEIPLKKCPYEGCTAKVYEFDDEHVEDCVFKPLKCHWCKNQIDCSTNDGIIAHFVNFCVVPFEHFNYEKDDDPDGQRYDINFFVKPQTGYVLSLGNRSPENQYLLVMMPRKTKGYSELALISSNKKYIKSLHKVCVGDTNEVINYKRLNIFLIRAFSFSLLNRFLFNHISTTYEVNGVQVIEQVSIEGEPDSPGNWTIEAYEEMHEKFMALLSKPPT